MTVTEMVIEKINVAKKMDDEELLHEYARMYAFAERERFDPADVRWAYIQEMHDEVLGRMTD